MRAGRLVLDRYDDGGVSGASLDRPALQQLLADVQAGKITIVVVYKVDRLTRSLADFAKLAPSPPRKIRGPQRLPSFTGTWPRGTSVLSRRKLH
jgi:Resolvase, N terminal domain